MKVRCFNTHIIVYFVFHIDHLVIIVLSAVAFVIVLTAIVIVVVVVIVVVIKQNKKVKLPMQEGKQLLIIFINDKLFNIANVTYQENTNEMVKPTTSLLNKTTVSANSYGVILR